MYTQFEKARIIGARSLQLSFGAPPLIKTSETSNPMEIAKKELEKGVIPIVVIK